MNLHKRHLATRDRRHRHHGSSRTRRLLATAVIAILLVITAGPPTHAAEIVHPDRESAYPPEILNITQDPWHPAWGEDVTVTVTLADATPVPDMVSLLFCRVEPGYACGLPELMESDDDGTTWVGTIGWEDDFMSPGLRHIGYNITLHDKQAGTRVYAPTGNYAIPDTYPEEADGIYFFYEVGPEQASLPGLAFGSLILLFVGLARIRRPSRPGGRRRDDG